MEPRSDDTRVGRVVVLDGGRGLVDCNSAAGEALRVEIEGEAASGLAAGDWVEVSDLRAVAPGRLQAAVVTRIARAASSAPFPSPSGEWARLRGRHPTRLPNLRRRAHALEAVRGFFSHRAFLEIEAPLLVPSPGTELHLSAFRVDGAGYLITSPEYQLKRLLAGGLDRIYAIARCFRQGEAGPHHNPEFTMIEWYRSPGAWREIAADVEALCAEVVTAVRGVPVIARGGRDVDLGAPWEYLSVREAMARYANVALDGDEPATELAAKARAAGHVVPDGLPWDDTFFSVFLPAVEPHLGQGRPTVLFDWPAPLCALARKKPGDPAVVERFEAYAGGLELCNGFGELIDAAEQRSRLEQDLAERARRGLPAYPIDEKFLGALAEGLPPCAGVALGFDRLAMLALGAEDIREVLAFTSDEL